MEGGLTGSVRSGLGDHDLLYVDRHDPFRKQGLLVGRDEIGVTLTHEAAIRSFEARRSEETPWVFPAAGDPTA